MIYTLTRRKPLYTYFKLSSAFQSNKKAMARVTRSATGSIPAKPVPAPVEAPKTKKAAPKANTGKKVASTKGAKPTGVKKTAAPKKKSTVAAKVEAAVEKTEEVAEKAADKVEEEVEEKVEEETPGEETAEEAVAEKPAPKKKAPAPKKPVAKKAAAPKKPVVKA
ncbi:hypothetical protein sscle_13g094460 [Sclerotinia sclerotiorum 1980 UF-70]|uniref:Uncharacterized protein n=2 Tax=Sclerotinia sclerotiorum (strain ATCC 18683 / 1980 / Ss-1) TaxID=665079 RepID=A0A1D9QIB9_SCLS1|nr:hypothetical protein sscle_13g094460 [Sclerotinia sclerotiorum 1980 UF-70]